MRYYEDYNFIFHYLHHCNIRIFRRFEYAKPVAGLRGGFWCLGYFYMDDNEAETTMNGFGRNIKLGVIKKNKNLSLHSPILYSSIIAYSEPFYIFVTMLRRILAILFLAVAQIVILGHSVVSHHHHAEIVNNDHQNSKDNHHNGSKETPLELAFSGFLHTGEHFPLLIQVKTELFSQRMM